MRVKHDSLRSDVNRAVVSGREHYKSGSCNGGLNYTVSYGELNELVVNASYCSSEQLYRHEDNYICTPSLDKAVYRILPPSSRRIRSIDLYYSHHLKTS